jgi:hypothetical protein
MNRLPLLAPCALMLLVAGSPRPAPGAPGAPGATGATGATAQAAPAKSGGSAPMAAPGASGSSPAAIAGGTSGAPPSNAAAAAPPLPAAPVNLDFEKGELGQRPAGWQMTAASERAGFGADLTDDQPYQGKTCAVVRGISYSRTPGTATLMQSFAATAYRGQRVRFRAAVRTDDSRAQLWLAVERPGQLPGFLDTMADRPIASSRWQVYEILGEVAADATRIGIGLNVSGDGRTWIDAGAFEVLGPAADAPPRPLDARGRTNLIAFARLLGYVRYFHPSDQSAAADWGSFTAAAVAELDPAAPASIAPAAPASTAPAAPASTEPAVPASTAPADGDSLAAALQRLFAPLAPTLRVFATGRRPPALDLGPPAGVAPAELRVVGWRHAGLGASGGPSLFSSVRLRAEPGGPGKPALADVDPRVPFAADLGGGASCLLPLAVWADAAGTLPRSPASAARGTAARGGTAPRDSTAAGGSAVGGSAAGASAAGASAAGASAAGGAAVGGSDAGGAAGTLAATTPAAAPVSLTDRSSRLAIVILAWNVLQHFDPSLAAGGVARAMAWQRALPAALAEAAEGTGVESLVDTLRRMVAVTDDGQATIVAIGDRRTHGLPLRWDWIEGQLVVTAVDAGVPGLHPGDAVTRVEGREVRSELQAAEALAAAATPQWRRWRAMANLALGERGEPVRLDVEPFAPAAGAAGAGSGADRAGGARTVDRAGASGAARRGGTRGSPTQAVTVTHSAPLGQLTAAQPPPEAVREASPGVLVVDLGRLSESELNAALPRLAAATGIVFDLRGTVRSTDSLLAHLVAGPVDPRREMIPTWPRPDREAVRYQPAAASIAPAAPRLQGRLAFLGSARDVGAAESLLATAAELHLGAIVGSPTGGAMGSVDSAPLPAGFTLIWTATRPAAGAPPAGAPVQPTVAVSPTRRGIATGRDEVLEKALALVAQPAGGR